MPQIDNTSEKVQNMLKANGIVEELQSDVIKLQSDVGDRSGHNLNLTEQVDVIHHRQDGYVSGSVAVPRAKKAEQDGEGNNIVGTYVDNNRFNELSNDLYQLFDSTTPMGDRTVKAATRDALGNEIHTTYSTKEDLLYAEGMIQEFQIEDEIIQIRDSERIKDIQPGVKYLNQASTGKRGVIVVPAPNDTQFFFDPDGNVYKRIKKEGMWTEWQPIGNDGGTNITVDSLLDGKSVNPVQNKVISDYLDALNYYGNMNFRPTSDSCFKFLGGYVESYSGSALMEVIVPYCYYGDSMMFIVNTIGTSAFQGEGLVESIVLPNTIEVIESLAFAECSILEKIRLPNRLRDLPDQVFFGCKNLTSITLPITIANIGVKAFDGSGLTDVYYEGTKEQWESITISEDNDTLNNATIHFNWTENLQSNNTISVDQMTSAPVGIYKVDYGDGVTFGHVIVCEDGDTRHLFQILPDGTIYRYGTTNQYATYDESTGELDSYIVAQKTKADKNGNIIDETYATKEDLQADFRTLTGEISSQVERATEEINSRIEKIENGEIIVDKAGYDAMGNMIHTTYATKEELSIKNLGFIDESSLDNLLEQGVYLYSFEKIEPNSKDTLYEILINEDLQSSAHNFITQRKLLSKERRSREYFVTEGIINHWNDWTSWEIDEDKVLLNWTSDVKLGYSSVPNANSAEHSVHDALGNIIHDTYATKQDIGDIETALDNIIAIQNELLGVNE